MGENISFNFAKISIEHQTQALDSVTGGLVASVDAKGIGAIQNGIDAFSGSGFDPAVVSGDKPIATEPGTFSSPVEYLQQIPESGSPQVLEQLEDPHFNHTEALTSTFQNIFGDGGVKDVANQLGMGMAPTSSQTSTNDPGEVAGGSNMPNDDSSSDPVGTSGGPFPGKAETNPLENASELPGLAGGDPGNQFPTLTGSGGIGEVRSSGKETNPLESAIQLSDVGAETGAPSTPGGQVSDGAGDGIHPTDTGEGGGKMPNPEVGMDGIGITDTGEGGGKMPAPEDSVARIHIDAGETSGRIDITDTGETSGEVVWQDNQDSMAIMGQRGSGEESATLDALGGGMPNEDSDGSTATPFFQDLFQNNYSKLQTMGDTLHELLSMQQDASDHH